MYAFGVPPDPNIHAMAGYLLSGTERIARGVHALDEDKSLVENEIRQAWNAYNALEDRYIQSMAVLLKTSDAFEGHPHTGNLPPPAGCRSGNAGHAGHPA